MVILQLSGGLGNQMFEYALYLSLRAKGKHVKIDDVSDYRTPDRRPVQLSVFDADYERASEDEVIRYTDSSLSPLSRIRRKLTGRKSLLYRERDMEYDETVFERDPVYLTGFFQSEKYFADVKEEVRRRLTFSERMKKEFSESYREILTRIEAVPSVSVHVRRGDYLHASHNGMYEGICTLGLLPKGDGADPGEGAGGGVFPLFQRHGMDEGASGRAGLRSGGGRKRRKGLSGPVSDEPLPP